MAIPLLDLKEQYRSLKDEILGVANEVFESQIFILGSKVVDFEREFASYCQAERSIGVSSGTDALLLALMALEIGPGDEVIVPAYSFFATAGVVQRVGALPVFVDIDADTFNMSPAEFERKITPRTKAVIPVHLFGQCADLDSIVEIATRHSIVVIEDAAQAVGSEINGRRAGSIGLMGCFSFFPSKNLGAFGDAGAVTTNDSDLAERLIDYRVHGMRPRYFHKYVGGNFRLDALQAAVLSVKLPHLDGWTKARQRNADLYRQQFSAAGVTERLNLPKVLENRRHIYNQFVIRFKEGRETRDRVMARLKQAEIGCDVYYPTTLPAQECFRHLASAHEKFPESEAAAADSLAIPIFPELRPEQISEVVETISHALNAG